MLFLSFQMKHASFACGRMLNLIHNRLQSVAAGFAQRVIATSALYTQHTCIVHVLGGGGGG